MTGKLFFQRKWLISGFALTLFFMGTIGFIFSKNTAELEESTKRVQRNYEIINNLTDFYAAMSVAESARRGYIYLGSQQELARYKTAIDNLNTELAEIQQQIDSDPIVKNDFLEFQSLVRQRLNLLKESISLYQKEKGAIEKQAAITGKSVVLREKILKSLNQIQFEEEKQLQVWLKKTHNNINKKTFLDFLSIFTIFIVIVSGFCLIYYQWIQKQKLIIFKQKINKERELSELKIRLFSMISHEFRTPLSVILGSSQLLGESLRNLVDESQLKNLQRIQSSVKLMNHLLTDMLTLTRAEAGKLECKPEWLDIESFCLNLVEDTQLLSLKNQQIKLISKNYCDRVYVDEKLLYSILNNLLLNAIKYSPDGGTIYLILAQTKDELILTVKDEGIGIPLEDRQKIYEPFYRGQNVDRIVGSGLGLAVVKECLELQGGTISLESEIGLGTTFTVKLPKNKQHKPAHSNSL
jgi:signal transduction histidine kinase